MRTRLSFVAVLVLLVLLQSSRTRGATESNGEVIIQWNQVLSDTLKVAGVQPPTVRVERSYAMLHIAMFDAVNSIEQEYSPYYVQVRSSKGASGEAAAAQAAHDVLTALYPSQQAVYDAALTAALADIPPGRARQGRAVGAAAATAILNRRSTDGWDVAPPPFNQSDLAGYWQPTPPGFRAATFTHFPDVVPFAVESATQFLPPSPPRLDSAEYAEAFTEVKTLGQDTSAVRTAEQTLVAQLYGGVGTRANPNTLWNGVARDVSRARGLGLIETARLFALLNATFHDALETSFASKYLYGLWRPVTAIQRAGEDGNPATEPDPGWMPLLTTPSYPSYTGNAAALSAASARSLERFFGTDDIAFDVFFEGINTPGVTRSYPGFWQFADEQARSRIYGGIHFEFDSTASQQMSVELVDWVFERFMVPR